MTEPKLEIIAAKLMERLQRITTDNGYFYTLKPERLQAITKPDHLKAVLYQDGISPVSDVMNEKVEKVSIAIATFIIAEEGDTTPLDTYQNRINACIYKAIMTDEAGNFDPQLEATVDRMDVQPPLPFQLIHEGKEGTTFYVDIQYRHSLTEIA